MGYVVSFANNKGGVGKTTTSVAVGQAWARMGRKVLFVDLDSQANLTGMISKKSPEEHEYTVRDAFMDYEPVVFEKFEENIDLLPSELALSNFDRDTASMNGREYLLLDFLKPYKEKYDLIVIDCPPALGLITYNAFIASDYLTLVTTGDALSYKGLMMVLSVYNDVRSSARLNKNLQLLGFVFTKYENTKLCKEYYKKISEEAGIYLIDPPINKATRLAQAGSFNQSIYDYDSSGRATQQYIEVSTRLLQRIETPE